MSSAKPKAYECKHAVYKAHPNGRDDIVLVKEVAHFEDGTTKPGIRFFNNYKQDYYITREGFRQHKQKKTYEKLDRVIKMPAINRAQMVGAIARSLNRPAFKGSLKQICDSPYVYGADITTPVLIKNEYATRWPETVSNYTVAVYDIETDMIDGTEEVLMAALTFKQKAILVVSERFLKQKASKEVDEKFVRTLDTYLGKIVKDRNVDIEFVVTPTIGAGLVKLFKRAHEWMPDFIAIWNIDFDIPRTIEAMEKEGIDVGDVLTHPTVPSEYRTIWYQQGSKIKRTADGKETPKAPAEQWHTLHCLASFYFVDAMAIYAELRKAKGKESYALDAVLSKHLGMRKLKFDDLLDQKFPGVRGGSALWHEIMQENFKFEYMVYNIFDCISVELLDELNNDMSQSFGVLCGFSEFSKFPSQPRRFYDNFHFFCLRNGFVCATTGTNTEPPYADLVISIRKHIVTLNSQLMIDNGLKIFQDMPDLHTEFRALVADLDCVSTYPKTQDALNIEKETTRRELIKIQHMSETTHRRVGLNLTAGRTNATEICQEIHRLPKLKQMLKLYENSIEEKERKAA